MMGVILLALDKPLILLLGFQTNIQIVIHVYFGFLLIKLITENTIPIVGFGPVCLGWSP